MNAMFRVNRVMSLLLCAGAATAQPAASSSAMPPQGTGELAAGSRAGKSLLSDISPAPDSHRDEVMTSIGRNYSGPVLVAEDGLRLNP